MTSRKVKNEEIAELLDQIADLLEAQEANPFRIQAYRKGAATARTMDESLAELMREGGKAALQELPNIGRGIARIINSMVQTGHSAVLERLQGEITPEKIFNRVPGIGAKLAHRLVEELDVATLEGLEQAVYDGRLQQLEGFGPKRVENIRVSLAGMLNRSAQRTRRQAKDEAKPAVETLLDVDKEYRRKAEAGKLRKIAPKRFNPEGKAWLPILHTERGDWEFTVLFSNTAQAHRLEKTEDWVVLYYERDGKEDQATAVTETQGALEGKRVIRGRESECQRYYEQN